MMLINVTTRISSDEEGTGREFAYKLTKVKVKVKLTLEQVTKAQRGSRGIALIFP